LMDPSKYPVSPHGIFCRRIPIAPVMISRGCPYPCTFCAARSVVGQKIRYRSVDNVVNEILLLYKTYGVREIHIADDNFTMKKDYVVSFCREIISRKLDLVFALPNGVRLDTLDEGMLKLMEKAGFYSTAVAVESGSDRVLKLMKKHMSKEKIREKIDLIKRVTKIDLTGFFMLGYPGETEDEILETIEFAKSLKLDKAAFALVMPLPGSELWELYKAKEKNISWKNFFTYQTVKGLSDIPEKKLNALQKKAFYGFYLRPKIILGLIGQIKTYAQVKSILNRAFNILTSS